MIRIPFDPTISADQQFQVLLPEQAVITITLRWNTRSEYWFMDISTGSGTAQGIKVVPRWPLLTHHKALSPIAGDIIVLPYGHSDPEAITYEALGTTWSIYWVSDDEVARWRSSHGLG